jgi:hypothetical protein
MTVIVSGRKKILQPTSVIVWNGYKPRCLLRPITGFCPFLMNIQRL